MSKPLFAFSFVDTPMVVTVESREWVANYLRAARKQAYLQIKRIGAHRYIVHGKAWTAAAILEAQS
jgi:hypothetical protein